MTLLDDEQWDIGDVEGPLEDLKADIAILGHLIGAGDEVERDTLRRVESALTESYASIEARWKAAWETTIAVRNRSKAALTEAKAALEAAKAELAAPGSVADVENADAVWSLLRSAARVTLNRCAERDQLRVTCLPDGQDDELIARCEHLLDLVTQMEELFEVRKTAEDEERTQDEMDALFERRSELADLIHDAAPVRTQRGHAALARAALAIADRNAEDEIVPRSKAESLAWIVVESLAPDPLSRKNAQ